MGYKLKIFFKKAQDQARCKQIRHHATAQPHGHLPQEDKSTTTLDTTTGQQQSEWGLRDHHSYTEHQEEIEINKARGKENALHILPQHYRGH